jgi:hypothetical protein
LPAYDAKDGKRWTPCDIKLKKRSDKEHKLPEDRPYRNIVGSLIYISTLARPDICYATNKTAQYMSDPGEAHWKALIQILVYLRTFPDFVIRYSSVCDQPNILIAYTDADLGGCYDTGKSTGGYCHVLNEGLIAWGSKRQTIVATSTAEAEYMCLSRCTAVTLSLRHMKHFFEQKPAGSATRLMFTIHDNKREGKGKRKVNENDGADIEDEIGPSAKRTKSGSDFTQPSTETNIDNQAAIDFAHNPVQQSQMRGLRLGFLRLRQEVNEFKTVEPVKVATKENMADGFTKLLSKEPFIYQRNFWVKIPMLRR